MKSDCIVYAKHGQKMHSWCHLHGKHDVVCIDGRNCVDRVFDCSTCTRDVVETLHAVSLFGKRPRLGGTATANVFEFGRRLYAVPARSHQRPVRAAAENRWDDVSANTHDRCPRITSCGSDRKGGCDAGYAVGVPVNVQTNHVNTSYSQVGMLTKEFGGMGGMPVILPLMGRALWNGRDKWQYYTMANTAASAINTKLPIKVNGRSCTDEYGCDSITTGDMVYVEGYGDVFRATIYENASLAYLPV